MLESPKILCWRPSEKKKTKRKRESKTKLYVFDTQSAGVLKRINIQFTVRYRARYNCVFPVCIRIASSTWNPQWNANDAKHFISAVYTVFTLITRSRLCLSISYQVTRHGIFLSLFVLCSFCFSFQRLIQFYWWRHAARPENEWSISKETEWQKQFEMKSMSWSALYNWPSPSCRSS